MISGIHTQEKLISVSSRARILVMLVFDMRVLGGRSPRLGPSISTHPALLSPTKVEILAVRARCCPGGPRRRAG
jgi:hypothetical protein